jgi:hypothetical protein
VDALPVHALILPPVQVAGRRCRCDALIRACICRDLPRRLSPLQALNDQLPAYCYKGAPVNVWVTLFCTHQRTSGRPSHSLYCMHACLAALGLHTSGTRRRDRRWPAEPAQPAVHGHLCASRHCWRWHACCGEHRHVPSGARPTTPWKLDKYLRERLLTFVCCVRNPLQALCCCL